MGNLQSKLSYDPCVDMHVRPTRIPPRQSGAARPCSTPSGGERIIIAVGTADSVSGCEGPSIASRYCVASQQVGVARDTLYFT
eukprot:scaffold638_cov66-Phaeocystis_antarctica.AAC.4